jgi:hypothetical protein
MNIILEGPDGSGKSTLAKLLSKATGYPLIAGEGPPKYPGEIDERIARLATHRNSIFDRHPAISSPIYDQFRTNAAPISAELIAKFYCSDIFIIYCRGAEILTHDINDNPSGSDTPEYLVWLERHHRLIFKSYEEWALEHAHFVYRKGSMSSLGILAELLT